jgi:alanine racemase
MDITAVPFGVLKAGDFVAVMGADSTHFDQLKTSNKSFVYERLCHLPANIERKVF